MRDHEKKFREYLKKKNLKSTPERMAVLKEVLSEDGHFDADQLFERIQRYNKSASRATIYRVLPLLVDAGFVAETLRCQGRVSYERVYGTDRHDHMVCDKCGKVIEFNSDKLNKILQGICDEHEFAQREHRLGVRGLCRDCVKEKINDNDTEKE